MVSLFPCGFLAENGVESLNIQHSAVVIGQRGLASIPASSWLVAYRCINITAHNIDRSCSTAQDIHLTQVIELAEGAAPRVPRAGQNTLSPSCTSLPQSPRLVYLLHPPHPRRPRSWDGNMGRDRIWQFLQMGRNCHCHGPRLGSNHHCHEPTDHHIIMAEIEPPGLGKPNPTVPASVRIS